MGDYTHYGTPLRELDDEEAPKKFQDDTVRDERGRRRFHGAFTGGFSAGYFNSVGTKEGFTPQNFVSSRSNRAGQSSGQCPEDFMDNEDRGEMGIAPQRVQLREGVRAQDSQSSKKSFGETYSRTAGVGSQRELLQAPLIRMLTTDTESVGVRILRNMGWRPGRGLGPTVCLKITYGPQLPENIPETTEIGPEEGANDILEAIQAAGGGKDNVWGLGYTPVQRLNLFGDRIDRERVTMSTATVEGRRVGIRGQAFGVGAFEEDDEDIYAKDDMTQYDFEEVDHRSSSKGQSSLDDRPMIESKKFKSTGGVIEGFVMAQILADASNTSQVSQNRVEIPPGWTPRATMLAVAARIMKDDSSLTTGPNKELSREDKVALISDRTQGSVFDLISAEDKARIEAAKKAIQDRDSTAQPKSADPVDSTRSVLPPAAQITDADEDDEGNESQKSTDAPGALSTVNIESLRPFAANPAKQDRFDRYIRFAELGHREMLPSIQPPTMSQWEAALEKKEFESTLLLVRPGLGLSSRFEKKVVQGVNHSSLPTGLHPSKDIAAIQSAISAQSKSTGPPIRELKDFGKETHGQTEWHPKALLCKRFNVPNPYPGDETIGVPAAATSSVSKVPSEPSDNLAAKSVDIEAPSSSTAPTTVHLEKAKSLPIKPASSSILGAFSVRRFEDLIEEEEAKTPPPADLFKFIFSDDEDEDDQSKDGVNDGTGTIEDSTTTKSTTGEDQTSLTDTNKIDDTSTRSNKDSTISTKKSSGLFADLDLSLLNKRPPPKPIQPVAHASRTEDEVALPPMGPKPPPVIPIERTMKIEKAVKRHRAHSFKEKRKRDSKKSRKEKKKKLKRKDSKKSKKHKKDRSSSSSSRSRKRTRRDRVDSGDDTSRSSSVDSDTSSSESDKDSDDIDERLKEKLRKLKS